MLRTQPNRTQSQQQIVDQLVERFGIDGSQVIFFPEDPNTPWLKAKLLAQIARQSGKFKVVSAEFVQYIEPLRQIVYQGNVVDLDGRIYSLPGVATIDEKIAASEEAASTHDLAEARSLRSSLDLAGFNPLDPVSVVPLNGEPPAAPRDPDIAEAAARVGDFARIKILSREKGLIVGKDASGYKRFLATNFEGATSAAGFDPVKRKSLIAALEAYQTPFDPSSMPEEFADLPEAEGAAAL